MATEDDLRRNWYGSFLGTEVFFGIKDNLRNDSDRASEREASGAAFARPKRRSDSLRRHGPRRLRPVAGKTLLDVCKWVKNIKPRTWDDFYNELRQNSDGRVQRGSLPFRIAQFYDEMVRFVQEGKVVDFVCPAGCWPTTSAMPSSLSTRVISTLARVETVAPIPP
jgi:hypothetical protein